MKINIKGIVDEDFVNYKKPSMFIAFPTCTFKCEKECGVRCCQNSALTKQENIEVDIDDIVSRYVSNDISSAIVIGGLEPFDSIFELQALVYRIRQQTQDDIVIYTGYNKDEIPLLVSLVSTGYDNIIVKFGRFIPDKPKRFDDVLGVWLASDNQYAEVVSQ